MRRDTKLAIVIGLIVVGFGAWYITLPDVSEQTGADRVPADKAKDKVDVPLAKVADIDKAVKDTSAKRTPLAKSDGVERPFRSRSMEVPKRPVLPPQPDLAESANRSHDRERSGVDPTKVDTQQSARLALPSSFGQATSRPAEAGAVVKPPELVERKAPKKPTELYKWHVIQSGDTYSALAYKYLGDAKYASLLAKANPGMHPRRLLVGSKIKIPNVPAPSDVVTDTSSPGASADASPIHRLMAEPLPSIPKDRSYTIKDGEDWSVLAERFMGSSSRWPELFELNRERVPHNPNILPAGTVIELPKSAAGN